nr:aromatic acid exporter family protein [Cellulosimicrobium arenosum]
MHPQWSIAAKGAVAAALAWYVGLLAPEPFSDYPYYAPLGAVVASTSTLVRSVRESVQATVAILLGAAIARLVDLVLVPGALSIAVVVGLALLVSGWARLGDMGFWAVTSALFVLIIGNTDKFGFVGAYAGLVAVGALVGVLVNLAIPPLPLLPSEVAMDRLRDTLAAQADDLAEGLEQNSPPSREEWEERRQAVDATLGQARVAVARTREATRANPRARRYREWARAQVRRGRALDESADVTDTLVRLVAEWENAGRDDLALGPHLRPDAARALRAYADALRAPWSPSSDERGADTPSENETRGRLDDATEGLRRAVRRSRQGVQADGDLDPQHDYFVAGAIVLALRRGHEALGRGLDAV